MSAALLRGLRTWVSFSAYSHAADNADDILEHLFRRWKDWWPIRRNGKPLPRKHATGRAALSTEQRMIGDYVALIGDIAKDASATPWELAVKAT